MKNRTIFFIKTAIILLVSAALLVGGIMAMPLFSNGTKALDENQLAPNVNIPTNEAPTTQTQLKGKFGIYSFVTEENGKSVVTLYSEEQIADFKTRRNNGEWFSLTAEEILYLIDDTQQLFKDYDIIRIRDIDGSTKTYLGESLISIDETPSYTDDKCDAIYRRIIALNQINSSDYYDNKVIVFNLDGNGSQESLEVLISNLYSIFWYAPTDNMDYFHYAFTLYPVNENCGALIIINNSPYYKEGIYYFPSVTNIITSNLNSYRLYFE